MYSSKLPADFNASHVTIEHLRAPENQKWLKAMRAHLEKGYPLKKYPFDPDKVKLDHDGKPIEFDAINFNQPALTNVFCVSDKDKFSPEVFKAIKYGLPENPPNKDASKTAKLSMDRPNKGVHPGNQDTFVKPSFQNGVLILADDAVNRCVDQVTQHFRSKFTSELNKVVPKLLLTISPQDFDKKLNKALFNITAPTVTSSTNLAELFLSVMHAEEEKEEHQLKTNSWANDVEEEDPFNCDDKS